MLVFYIGCVGISLVALVLRWLRWYFVGTVGITLVVIPSLNVVRGCPRGVMVKAMDCGIVVSEFVLQSRYHVHFRTNTLGKGMSPLILPAMG